jgi:hypothetical protein
VVIDLNRLPSHGGHVATFLRQAKTTRHVPIIFIEGDPQKTARVRKLLPDDVYTPWSRVRSAVREALRRKPEQPVVPDTMAGYSGTPLPRKLGIRAGGSSRGGVGRPPERGRRRRRVPRGTTRDMSLRPRASRILCAIGRVHRSPEQLRAPLS